MTQAAYNALPVNEGPAHPLRDHRMTTLNEASAMYMGTIGVPKVYAGPTQAWPVVPTGYPGAILGTAGLVATGAWVRRRAPPRRPRAGGVHPGVYVNSPDARRGGRDRDGNTADHPQRDHQYAFPGSPAATSSESWVVDRPELLAGPVAGRGRQRDDGGVDQPQRHRARGSRRGSSARARRLLHAPGRQHRAIPLRASRAWRSCAVPRRATCRPRAGTTWWAPRTAPRSSSTSTAWTARAA